MDVAVFREKLNKVDGKIYVIEEEVTMPESGIYEAELQHDNISEATLTVYTGSKLTGDRIQTYSLSTPSLTPWKRIIRVQTTVPVIYICYETDGDTVEAGDVNRLQEEIVKTQQGVNAEINRATEAEKANANAIISETSKAIAREEELKGNIDKQMAVVDSEIQALKAVDQTLDEKKANAEDVSKELANRYTKDQVFTKEEVLRKIEELIGSAPETLDAFNEIADALGNDPNFASTIMTALANKVEKVSGKELSTNDYSDSEKAIVADVNSKKHTHPNETVLNKITQSLMDSWNAALPAAQYTAAVILKKLLTIDGAGSGLDADLLDGKEASHFAAAAEIPTKTSQLENDAGFVTSEEVGSNSEHEHTVDQITDFPSALKNPYAIEILLNGVLQASYDGSSKKNINITASSIGAAVSTHNHDSTYLKKNAVAWDDLKGVST